MINLGMLGYYKYFGYFSHCINAICRKDILPSVQIALPIGISFFTFQALSYIVDVYRGDTEASINPINVALYISFFPQLIAGPIVKYRDINRQIKERYINWIAVSDGFKRFIYGLGKKVLIANTMGLCVDKVYAYDMASVDSKMAWIGALAYTFQIYYDFSGYSDMAIGLGKMFGFTILENFDYPYLSKSISEFWRRWHISLGSWFREYVYIPLGGNRKGKKKTYFNLLVVFFLTGLWHGAHISFVIWGLYHGFFAMLERIWLKSVLVKSRVCAWIYTFVVVNFGWVLFRAGGIRKGLFFLERMIFPWRYLNSTVATWNYVDNKTIFFFLCAVFGMGLIGKLSSQRIKSFWNNSVPEAVFCVGILFLSIVSVVGDTYNPFIYFQF